ncbi:hypothetical protein A3852_28090 [Rhodococcus qingshengii]|nr:hypothetical protein A3852_28090 [Rhodococcus qingshengii]
MGPVSAILRRGTPADLPTDKACVRREPVSIGAAVRGLLGQPHLHIFAHMFDNLLLHAAHSITPAASGRPERNYPFRHFGLL